MKGKWRISHQLRNPARQHIFSISYDEFTADNELNRIFRFVVERLLRLTRDAGNRQTLEELREWMVEVTLLPHFTAAQAPPTLLTRLNARFTSLLNLARLFLDDGSIQVASGDFSTFAFVFDMNALFESFIVEFIRRHRKMILPPALKNVELLPQSAGADRHLALRNGRDVFQLKPDLAMRQGAQFPLLLDTKYKQLRKEDRKLGVSSADFYQMHAYARRYACARVLLLYPQTAEMSEPPCASFVLKGDDGEIGASTIEVRTVNLMIDLSHQRGAKALAKELATIFGGAICERNSVSPIA